MQGTETTETTETAAVDSTPIPAPTVGRVVHFHQPGKERPALAHVTHVYTPGALLVELYVIPCSWDGTPHYQTSVPHESAASPGQSYWAWPPRV